MWSGSGIVTIEARIAAWRCVSVAMGPGRLEEGRREEGREVAVRMTCVGGVRIQ